MDKNSFIIAIYVDNKSGVLTRVSSLFTRRGYNIDTLSVGEAEDPNFSRITVSMRGTSEERIQLISQLKKLYNVKKVEVISAEQGIRRELLLVKVRNTPETRADLRDTVDVFKAKIIDYSADAMCLEITGDTSKVNAFLDNMKLFGIIEICRTGIVAIERGPESLINK